MKRRRACFHADLTIIPARLKLNRARAGGFRSSNEKAGRLSRERK